MTVLLISIALFLVLLLGLRWRRRASVVRATVDLGITRPGAGDLVTLGGEEPGILTYDDYIRARVWEYFGVPKVSTTPGWDAMETGSVVCKGKWRGRMLSFF